MDYDWNDGCHFLVVVSETEVCAFSLLSFSSSAGRRQRIQKPQRAGMEPQYGRSLDPWKTAHQLAAIGVGWSCEPHNFYWARSPKFGDV